MRRGELIDVVRRSTADTLIAQRLREALGFPKLAKPGRSRHKHRGQRKKHAHMGECRKQKHGVRL